MCSESDCDLIFQLAVCNKNSDPILSSGGSSFIVATPLAGLVSQGGEEVAARQGFIIVETNFR